MITYRKTRLPYTLWKKESNLNFALTGQSLHKLYTLYATNE